MNRRSMVTSLGATALGVGVLLGGRSGAFAQDADTDDQATTGQFDPAAARAEFEAKRAENYQQFVAALASELGDEETAVDAAIRSALQQGVDARLAAGDIDKEQAAAAKAVIEVSDTPLLAGFGGPGMGGPGGPGGRSGFGGGRGHGGPGGFGGQRGERGKNARPGGA
ncbi:MAG: hypothetical protein QM692_18425, partial [Thermomicrobiales bacterium]